MLYSSLKTGIKISRLGLGTVNFGENYGFSGKKPQSEVNRILEKCRESGVNLIDTARDYGDSERKIGLYFKEYGTAADFFTATKITRIDPETASVRKELEACIRASVQTSLWELNLDKINLLQLHQSDEFLSENGYFPDIIRLLKKENLVEFFGVSVYEPGRLKSLLESWGNEIDFLQLPYNIFDRKFERDFDLIRSLGIEVICRSVFLKGLITARKEDIPEELKGILVYRDHLAGIAEKSGFTLPELCLLFTLSESRLSTSIVGVDSAEELYANVKTLGKTDELSGDILSGLRKIEVKDGFLTDPRRWRSL